MPVRSLFFTGTDTGVGKTFVVSAVARLLREQGRDVHVRKPVATGARWENGQWVSEDTRRLADAAHVAADSSTFSLITPWAFEPAVAPPVAARLANVSLCLDEIADACAMPPAADGILLIEGVGGLLCPLTDDATVADLAQRLAAPIVVVTRRSLGTLNHTLLTLEVAQKRGLNVVGVVMNETERPMGLADQTNVEELKQRIQVPLLGVVAWQQHGSAAPPTSLTSVDWWETAGCTGPVGF